MMIENHFLYCEEDLDLKFILASSKCHINFQFKHKKQIDKMKINFDMNEKTLQIFFKQITAAY